MSQTVNTKCRYCGKLIKHSIKVKRAYCSYTCNNNRAKDIRKEDYAKVGMVEKIAHGNRGSIAELLICADLIGKGYYLFNRAVPHSPFDLVAYKNSQTFLIEVKSSLYLNKIVPTQNEYTVLAIYFFLQREIRYYDKNNNLITM